MRNVLASVVIGVAVCWLPAVTVQVMSQAKPLQSTVREIALPDAGNSDTRALSPDGRFVAFKSDDEPGRGPRQMRDLSVRELATGAVRKVATHTATDQMGGSRTIAWARDSSRLAYVWCQSADQTTKAPGRCDLRIDALDGSTPRIVVPRTQGRIEVYDWSPDARHVLALIPRKGPCVVAIEDGRQRELTLANLDPDDELLFNGSAFSPDGRYIAYTRERWQDKPYPAYLPGDVFILDLDEGTDRPVLQGPAADKFLAWTPNGTSLLLTSDREGVIDLWLADVRNGTVVGMPTVVRRNTGSITGMGLTPFGQLFYRTAFTQTWDVQIVDFDPITGRTSSSPRNVSTDLSRRRSTAIWSPDGKRLAYRSAPAKPVPDYVAAGYDAIGILDLASGIERHVQLKHACVESWSNWAIAWSSEPRALLLSVTAAAAACRGLYGVDIQTGSISALLKGTEGQTYITEGQPLPDGKSLLFARGYQTVVISDPATNQERIVLDLRQPSSGFEGGSLMSLRLSHDGKRAAAVIRTRDKQSRLAELSLGDGRLRVIQDEVQAWETLAWTGDDRYLLYVQNAGAGQPGYVWRVPVAGGRPEQIGLTTDSPDDLIRSLSVRPDGRAIAFQRERTSQPKIFVLENFLPERVLRLSAPGGAK